MSNWNATTARKLYGVHRWGEGYVDINDDGEVVVRPEGSGGGEVALAALIQEIRALELSVPVLVRFPDILRDRVARLREAFRHARADMEYEGRYSVVYPIKVNQQRTVLEGLLTADEGVGLEVGSKAELMAVLALATPGSTVICNGYKDREYIHLALIGRALGLRCFIVIEKPSDLDYVIELARELQIAPLLGVRARLASLGSGNWQNTGGDRAKFGLTVDQLVKVVQRIQEERLTGSLQLLHFHMGSQIPNIRDMQRGMQEAARHFAELHRLGIPISVVDVGGGIGVDYEGRRSRSSCSMNYGMQEYANNVVRTLADVCRENGLPHPEIITEAGRAMTAHHAVLITQVIDTEMVEESAAFPPPEGGGPVLQHLWELLKSDAPLAERFHDVQHWLTEAQTLYEHGMLNIHQREMAERLARHILRTVQKGLNAIPSAAPDVLRELDERLADKYFCNFSLFQSIPDVWGIDQIFPILPLTRLNEEPTRSAVLADLTCDSDGQISRYVVQERIESILPLHPLKDDEPYYLGIFLVGAYQEILGDLHNLFGDTDSINVEMDEEDYRLNEPRQGDCVQDLLGYVDFAPEPLAQRFLAKLERADLRPEQRAAFREAWELGLRGYSYLEE